MEIDLKKFRKENGLLQRDIADKIETHQSRISKYEKGIERTTFLTNKIIENFPNAANYFFKSENFPNSDEYNSGEPEYILQQLEIKRKVLIGKILGIEQEIISLIDMFPSLRKSHHIGLKEIMEKHLQVSAS